MTAAAHATNDLSSAIEIVSSSPAYAVFIIDDVLVQIYEAESPGEAFVAILARIIRWRRDEPQRPLWMLTIVGGRASMPDSRSRAIAAEFPRYFSSFSLVADGTGFRAAVVRAVMTSMHLLAPVKVASPKVSATVDDGIADLVANSGGVVDGARLKTAIGLVRSRLRPR